MNTPLDVTEFARLAADRFARSLGADLLEARPGYARAVLTVTQAMTNSLGWPHGGVLFTLADFAFAAACNAAAPPTVALSVSLNFLAPAQVGERLEAEAEMRGGKGRTSLYRLSVWGAEGSLLAEGHGLARTLPRVRGLRSTPGP